MNPAFIVLITVASLLKIKKNLRGSSARTWEENTKKSDDNHITMFKKQ